MSIYLINKKTHDKIGTELVSGAHHNLSINKYPFSTLIFN